MSISTSSAWSPVSIGKPAPKIHQWTIYFCRWGFGWVDKAQCFRSARRFGAAGSSPDFSRVFSWHGASRPLSWTFFQCTLLSYPGQPSYSHAFRWASDLAKFYQDWGPDLCESRRRAHSLIGVSFECPYQRPPRGLPCRLESLRLKFTNEPSIFVDGDLDESIKRSASDRQGDLVPQVRARTFPGVFHDMALLGLCLERSFNVLYCRTQANPPTLTFFVLFLWKLSKERCHRFFYSFPTISGDETKSGYVEKHLFCTFRNISEG